jgi:hypothetical protein
MLQLTGTYVEYIYNKINKWYKHEFNLDHLVIFFLEAQAT